MSNTNYRLAHTMMRVLDLEKSIHFYCDILGMQVLRRTIQEEDLLMHLLDMALK